MKVIAKIHIVTHGITYVSGAQKVFYSKDSFAIEDIDMMFPSHLIHRNKF